MFWRKQAFRLSKQEVCMSKPIKQLLTNALDLAKREFVKAAWRQSIGNRLEIINRQLNFGNSTPDARQQVDWDRVIEGIAPIQVQRNVA